MSETLPPAAPAYGDCRCPCHGCPSIVHVIACCFPKTAAETEREAATLLLALAKTSKIADRVAKIRAKRVKVSTLREGSEYYISASDLDFLLDSLEKADELLGDASGVVGIDESEPGEDEYVLKECIRAFRKGELV